MIAMCTCHELQGSESDDDEEWRKLPVAMMMGHSKGSCPDDEALLEGYVTTLQQSRIWGMNKYQYDKICDGSMQYGL